MSMSVDSRDGRCAARAVEKFSRWFQVWLVCLFLGSCVLVWHNSARSAPLPDSFAEHKILFVFDERNSPILFPEEFSPKVVYQDRAGRYWVGGSISSTESVLLYDEVVGQWTVFGPEPEKAETIFRYRSGAVIPHDIETIGQSKDGRMWFSSGLTNVEELKRRTVLSSFDGRRWQAHPLSVEPRYPNDRYETVFRGMFVGPSGDTWFWINDRLTLYDGKRWKDFPLGDIIPDPKPVIPDAQKGTPEAAVIANVFKQRYDILSGLQDRAGIVWLVTDSGILTYEKSRDHWQKLTQIRRITAGTIYEDRHRRIWLTDGYNVVCYDPRSQSSTEYDLTEHIHRFDLNCLLAGIYQDREDRILFVFDDGILVFREAKGSWDFSDTRAFADAPRISQLAEDRRGRLWLVTNSAIAVLAP